MEHFKDKNTTVVILTGFRGDLAMNKNVQRNKAIAATSRNEGFGYFFVDGYWIENQGTEDEVKVSEDSIFVVTNDPNESQKLIDLAHKLGNKYDQDAIFVKTPEQVYLYNKDGSKIKLTGGLKPGKLGDFYTKLRTNKKANTFVFESERLPDGFFKSYRNFILSQQNKG